MLLVDGQTFHLFLYFCLQKGEVIVPNDDTVMIESDGSLSLSVSNGDDSGEYSCIAINAAGYATRKVQLTVYGELH